MGTHGHHWEASVMVLGVQAALALISKWVSDSPQPLLTIPLGQVPPKGLWVEYPRPCVKAHRHHCGLSCSVNGDVRFFDPRMPESVNVLQIVKGLTALDIHPQANLIAWYVPCHL
jgi:hypothetical protein